MDRVNARNGRARIAAGWAAERSRRLSRSVSNAVAASGRGRAATLEGMVETDPVSRLYQPICQFSLYMG